MEKNVLNRLILYLCLVLFNFCNASLLFGNRAVSVLQSGNIIHYIVTLSSSLLGLTELCEPFRSVLLTEYM